MIGGIIKKIKYVIEIFKGSREYRKYYPRRKAAYDNLRGIINKCDGKAEEESFEKMLCTACRDYGDAFVLHCKQCDKK
jgi:hypothetical protein